MSSDLCASIIYHSLAVIPIVMYPVDAAIVSVVSCELQQVERQTRLKFICEYSAILIYLS